MNELWGEVKKHLQVYSLFVKNSVINDLEYRANFFFKSFFMVILTSMKLMFAVIVYNTKVSVLGLSPYEIILFIGTFILMSAFCDGCWAINSNKLSQHIKNGDLDLYMTKPISLQFMSTCRYFDLPLPLANLFSGITVIIIAWNKAEIPVNFVNITGYVVYFIGGMIVAYSILMLPGLLAFWITETNAVNSLVWGLWDMNNMPMAIYSKFISRIGVFAIPIFVITNFPCMFVLRQLSGVYIIWGLVVPILIFGILRMLWKVSVKKYSSASS